MRISAAFPSKYLKAADLQGKQVTVVMSHVTMETIGDDERPVLYFKGKDKGLVLNKTNANTIADAFGDDTAGLARRRNRPFRDEGRLSGKDDGRHPVPGSAAQAGVEADRNRR